MLEASRRRTVETGPIAPPAILSGDDQLWSFDAMATVHQTSLGRGTGVEQRQGLVGVIATAQRGRTRAGFGAWSDPSRIGRSVGLEGIPLWTEIRHLGIIDVGHDACSRELAERSGF